MSDSTERLRSLPDWAQELVQSTREAVTPSPGGHRDDDAWPLLLDAATVATFLPRELQPSASLGDAERRKAEQSVLDLSELAAPGSRWTLTRESRRQVLAQCRPGELREWIERAPSTDADPLTRILRGYLRGDAPADFEALSLEELEAHRVAAGWLRGIGGVELPPVEELDRHLELRRLLAPFERMIGRRPGRPDRFFGRKDEIENLREYVRVIEADNWAQAAVRGLKSAVRFFRGRKPKTVWGTGGVGKTTLISYFMLEHAHAAQDCFPFAYLDFDRSTVSARNRAALLAEIARQVGAQFRRLTGPMAELRRELADAARKIAVSPESDSVALITPYALRFRSIIDEAFDHEPFLLVFDTFEIVQYAPDQVRALEELVRAFTSSEDAWQASRGDTPVWGRLRLVISGRKHVKEFLGGAEDLDKEGLGPLDADGSAQMLQALAEDAGKPVPIEDAKRLVEAVRKDSRERPRAEARGVRPLRLRLVGEVFREEKGDGPSIAASLIQELEHPDEEHKKLGRLLIDGILVRRILGHVRDANVRALADPGLVVRRITKDVIREVMTKGTDLSRTDDPVEITPWIVDDDHAQKIFEAFGHEVSLVESDGDALRHRQDVRAEMLPLIRKRRPNGFRRIHQLAYDYFRAKAGEATPDPAAAEEAIYHGLWLGIPVEELDALYPAGGRQLRIDPEEFEESSIQRLYLRARGDELLTAEEAALLPQSVGVDWLGRCARKWLDATRLNEYVPIIRVVSSSDYSAFDRRKDVAALIARLLFRAGEWEDAARLLRRHVGGEISVTQSAEQSLLRTWATLMAKSGVPPEHLEWVVLAASDIRDPLVRTEVLAHAALAQERNETTLFSAQMFHAAVEVSASHWRGALRTLRLAIAARPPFGLEKLLEWFVEACDQLPRDRSVAASLSSILGREVPVEALDSVWREERWNIIRSLSDAHRVEELRRIAITDYGDWFLPFGNALTRVMGDVPARQALSHRFEDWIIDIRFPIESRDGHTLVQFLTTEGLLIDFAERIAAPARDGRYPDTVSHIAAALVRWHHIMQ